MSGFKKLTDSRSRTDVGDAVLAASSSSSRMALHWSAVSATGFVSAPTTSRRSTVEPRTRAAFCCTFAPNMFYNRVLGEREVFAGF